MTPIPIPAQAPAKEGVAQIPDTRLWYWDTGGTGVPIVLAHPATGSGLIWGYQQPVFAKAGYRVIGYSRRGYINSAPFDRNKRQIDVSYVWETAQLFLATRVALEEKREVVVHGRSGSGGFDE